MKEPRSLGAGLFNWPSCTQGENSGRGEQECPLPHLAMVMIVIIATHAAAFANFFELMAAVISLAAAFSVLANRSL